MADNYLERRMEDMRSGRLSASSSSSKSTGKPLGRLAGKHAVVTGGARGIGRQIAFRLRQAGATVDILDIDDIGGNESARSAGCKFRHVDISDPETYRDVLGEIIRERGSLDILVNNAAIVDFVPLEENTPERFMQSLSVNLLPILVGAKVMHADRMSRPTAERRGGRIINICSTRAVMSEAGTENYSASKGGIRSLTHALMMSMADAGVTVNSISPGWIETDPHAVHSEEDRTQHPSGRVGVPDDIARLCIFLCENGNDFINGEDIAVDGGMTHKMIYAE